MIRIAIIGDIGSGKSYLSRNFGFPVFNADEEVIKLYKKNKIIFKKLNKSLPKYIKTYPINKNEISKSILANKSNLNKIISIVIFKQIIINHTRLIGCINEFLMV